MLFSAIGASRMQCRGRSSLDFGKEQYDLARGWLEALRARIASACDNIEISVAVVPGNHDCDLRRPSDVREFDLIEPRLTKMDPSGDLARHWLEVQDEYFAFASQLDGNYCVSADRAPV